MKTIRKIEKSGSSHCFARLRVAAYCRVSTAQYEQLESLETQRAHYDDYIRAHKDWELVNVYYDEGISGTRADTRPGLQRLMADCRLRRIDMVLTKSISRFARNTADCLALVRELISLNIPIHFEKEGIDTSAMESELLLSVMSSLAESESRSISENTKWSFGRQFRNGTFKVRTPPYGYRRENGRLQIEPEEAQIVKRIFREALSGKGASVIASGLNRDGIMSRQRKGWVHSTIFRILRNEVYTGDALYQKTFTDDEYRRHWNTKGEHTQFLATEHHDAIISREDFAAVETLISQRASMRNISPKSDKYLNRYAFSRKIFCGECGHIFKRRIHSSTRSAYVAWCCQEHLKNLKACSMKSVREDDIEFAFCVMMNKLIFAGKLLLRPYLDEFKKNSSDAELKRIAKLENELEKNTEKNYSVRRLMAGNYIPPAICNQELNTLKAYASKLKAEIAALEKSAEGSGSVISAIRELIAFTGENRMLTKFDGEIFKKFVNRITIMDRNHISFELKCGLALKEEL